MEGPRAHIFTISNNDAALRRAVRIVARLNLAYFGGGALAVNLFFVGLLARFRTDSGSLTRAAFLLARNNALAISPSLQPV